MVMNTVPVPKRRYDVNNDQYWDEMSEKVGEFYHAPYIPFEEPSFDDNATDENIMKVKVIDMKRHFEAQYKPVEPGKGKVEFVTVPLPAVKHESEKFTTIADEYFK
jgi:hypothetical protein